MSSRVLGDLLSLELIGMGQEHFSPRAVDQRLCRGVVCVPKLRLSLVALNPDDLYRTMEENLRHTCSAYFACSPTTLRSDQYRNSLMKD